MKRITKLIGTALSFLSYKWLLTMVTIVRNLLRTVNNHKEDKKKLSRQERKTSKHHCVPIDHPNYHRPDPMIYSQHYLMSLGFPVTWHNPDIELKKDGISVLSSSLEPNELYEIVARVWNNSFDAVVVGMPVVFSYLSFGAVGYSNPQSNPIGQTDTNLSVLGGSQNPSFVSMFWRTPPTPGHYCIQVNLLWSDDKNPNNNMGQRNVDVVVSRSPAEFTFLVENNDKIPHNYHMLTDTYTIPALEDNSKNRPKSQTPQYIKLIKARHSRSNFPIPPGWDVRFSAPEFSLLPSESIMIKVSIIPPDSFVGSQPFNINVFDDGNDLTGGVTIYVNKGLGDKATIENK